MSNARLKIFAFDSAKFTSDQIEDEVNKFLERKDISVDTADVEMMPDDTTIVKIVYKLRKGTNKNPPEKNKR